MSEGLIAVAGPAFGDALSDSCYTGPALHHVQVVVPKPGR